MIVVAVDVAVATAEVAAYGGAEALISQDWPLTGDDSPQLGRKIQPRPRAFWINSPSVISKYSDEGK